MTEDTTATEVETEDMADGPKQLREALKRQQAENAKLRTQLLDRAYSEAGLDPSTGLGKAIAKEFDGEPTAEALLTFAKEEYDYEPPTSDPAPQATQRREAQQQIEKVEAATVPSQTLTPKEAERQAQADGNLELAGRIKAQRLAERMGLT